MKADLTLPENRAAFICQYYGQNVWYNGRDLCPVCADDIAIIALRRIPLSLRHISSLTEEEKKRLKYITHVPIDVEGLVECIDNDYPITEFDFAYNCNATDIISVFDELRRLGILIPWRGNSCDDLLASGVAVYREERKEGA
jgi:hypothetical protein